MNQEHDKRFRRYQPEGTDWVVERKKQHIKGKLQDKFPSAEKCFQALDEDGGGSLDRWQPSTSICFCKF
jgi:hypothetical protein